MWRYAKGPFSEEDALINEYASVSATLYNNKIYLNGGVWWGADYQYLYCINLTYPVPDTTAPVIKVYDEYITKPVAIGNDLPIFCKAVDNGGLGVKEVKLKITGGPSKILTIDCERIDRQGFWLGYVPKNEITVSGITYQFEAKDASGNTTTSSSYSISAEVKSVPGFWLV